MDTMQQARADTSKWWHVPWPVLLLMAIILLDTIGMVLPDVRSWWKGPAIHVSVRNWSDQPLMSVVVRATGVSCSLGDIEQGSFCFSVIRLTAKSHLEVQYANAEGRVISIDAGGPFEPGSSGHVIVTAKPGGIIEKEQRVARP